MRDLQVPVTVTLGLSDAVIRRPGTSRPVIAKVLGVTRNPNGDVTKVWLDRLVHEAGDKFAGWTASGAVVTELSML